MKSDSLLYFNTPYDFFDFYNKLGIYNEWRIQEGLMNDRGKVIENKLYTRTLRDLFKEKGFFRRNASLAEIVSWLDNLSLVRRLLLKLEVELKIEEFLGIHICVEYMIKMSKRMRLDYILVFDNKMLLLEMRTVNSFSKVRTTWDKKFSELLIYKELMSYYIDKYFFRLYALIPLFEYRGSKRVQKNYENNENQLNYLKTYIIEYLIR